MAPDEERPGEYPAKPSTAPKRRWDVLIESEVVSPPATTQSDDDQKKDDYQKAIAELILTGDRGSLLRAFRIDARKASSVIVDHDWLSDPRWVDIAPTLAPALASLLEEQGQAAEEQAPVEAPALEQKPFVRLYIAKTLACITRKPEALDILLRKAAAFGDKAHDLMHSALGFFKPLEVMPNLIRFLRRACGSNQAAWQVFFASIAYLINAAFRAYKDSPADAERFLDMTLSLFAEILGTDERLDEWVEEDVVRLVSTRATPLAGGLKPVVAKLGKASGVAADRIAWRVYRGVLLGHDSNLTNRKTAAEWVTQHPSEVSEFGGPSAWRVYVKIIRYSREWKYRVKAIRDLGAYGPTSTRDPLPDDVKEVQDFLEDLSKTADDPDLRKVAITALAQNRARGEEAVRETRVIVCAIGWEPSAALPSECLICPVEFPRVPIHLSLTDIPSLGQTSLVSRMEASQRDSTAAPFPDLDLSSHQFTTNGEGDGFSPVGSSTAAIAVPADQVDLAAVSFRNEAARASGTVSALQPSPDPIARVGVMWRTLRDIAADYPGAIPAILEGSRSFSADFGADASTSISIAKPIIDRPIRPTAEPFLDYGEMKRWAHDIERWRVGAPFDQAMAEVRDFLDFYEGKHFPTPEENVALADVATGLVAQVGCEFRYNGEKARLSCVPATGRFEVRPRKRGNSLTTSNDFPSLEITPQEGSTKAVTS